MDIALEEAHLAARRGEVPVGAVLVREGEILAQAGNQTRELNDPSAHAELLVIREVCSNLKSQRLPNCDLYVSLEPCTLCASAISFARIRRLYFGAEDVKGGAVVNGVRFYANDACHHAPEVYGGIAEEKSQEVLQRFFQMRRENASKAEML